MTPLQRLLSCLGLALAVLGLGACEKHRFEDTKILHGGHHGHADEADESDEAASESAAGDAGDAGGDEGAAGVARDLGV